MRLAEELSLYSLYFLKDDAGASLIEYALIGLLVSIVCMLLFLAVGKKK